jgi:deoxyribodipyrimidine photo-lyase
MADTTSSSDAAPVIVWFRQDLRLTDNPALHAAAASGRPVIPLYILDDETPGRWQAGGASRWWLHHSLAALAADLEKLASRLILKRGRAAAILRQLAAEVDAAAVNWNRCYEPFAIARDKTLKSHLSSDGIAVGSFNAALAFEPWTKQTQSGGPYRVFTPFWKACRDGEAPPRPEPAPETLVAPEAWPESDELDDWRLLPTGPDWAGGLRETWSPGEAGAHERLEAFLDDAVKSYGKDRDRPGIEATSRLSPHLHFGEVGPRQIWHRVHAWAAGALKGPPSGGAETFLKELVWREFSYHLLYHFPELPEKPLRPEFADFPWREDETGLRAWQAGRTGHPIVDAGMRELWATGYMHNRVRMIAASFLIKDLLLPWQAGEAWFWDTLVDADLASNSASWQWVAGCGADAAPYFRIFNPVLQGEKFDTQGDYVRRWVPEIAALPDKFLHKPWEAPEVILREAGIVLGKDYPEPIVDHRAARARALDAFEEIRKGG